MYYHWLKYYVTLYVLHMFLFPGDTFVNKTIFKSFIQSSFALSSFKKKIKPRLFMTLVTFTEWFFDFQILEKILSSIYCIWIINEVKKKKKRNILPTCHTETVMIFFLLILTYHNSLNNNNKDILTGRPRHICGFQRNPAKMIK